MVNIVVGGRGAGGTEERQWAGLVGELVFGMVVPGNAFGCKSLNNVTNSSFFFVPVVGSQFTAGVHNQSDNLTK